MISFQDAHLGAANDVARRFYSYVQRDDLLSEGFLWSLEHRKRLEHYDKDENAKRAQYRLLRDLTMCMEQYARKEKAARLGYDIADEAFYSEALIGLLLPSVLNKDYATPRGEESEVRGNSDPAEGGTWQAQLTDVARAWNEAPLAERERGAILMYYGLGYSQDDIATHLGVDQSSVSRRIDSGLRKMNAALGGTKPRDCPYDCECHEGRLRVRPGIHSNDSGVNQELR